MLQKEKHTLQNFEEAIELEWLETNGLGGWSSSSVTGCNTRRYHGLLVAATVPPAERMSLVSKLEEAIVTGDERFELSVNNFGGQIIPRGYQYLSGFQKELFPEFTYKVGDITLKKTIAMVHGENTVIIIYDVVSAGTTFNMELLPLLSVRGYHNTMHANDGINRDASFKNSVFEAKPYEGTPGIFIKIPGAGYRHNPNWYFNFNYTVEQLRGLDYVEDLFNPGTFTVALKQGDSLGIVISTDNAYAKDARQLFDSERQRREALLNDEAADEITRQLVLAADQFIVKRDTSLKTVIAGYHWFTDWSRDTMISLPGLCLATGRFEDAKKILAAFASSVSQGMLPNRFRDSGEEPEYNTADGTLWYFIAVHKYLQATKDKRFIVKEILPVLKEIIEWHQKGTRFHIHETEDGLLYSGEKGVQLTWMDAKVGNWVVTPRIGKAVEINALWYNALNIYADILELNNTKKQAKEIRARAGVTKDSFNETFWNKSGGYLYDVVDSDLKDDSFRPNQLFAITLPYSLIDDKKAKMILKLVSEKLYTPVGLRTLPQTDPNYMGYYEGDQMSRDSAYHQGTAWSWLIGPYVDAIMKLKGKPAKKQAEKIIQDFIYHLTEAGMGTVSEIFDGDAPHHPQGCIAQAWGVAELLRVIKQYGLSNLAAKKPIVKAKSTKVKPQRVAV